MYVFYNYCNITCTHLGTPGGARLGRDGTWGGGPPKGSGEAPGLEGTGGTPTNGGPGAVRPPGRGGPGGARRCGVGLDIGDLSVTDQISDCITQALPRGRRSPPPPLTHHSLASHTDTQKNQEGKAGKMEVFRGHPNNFKVEPGSRGSQEEKTIYKEAPDPKAVNELEHQRAPSDNARATRQKVPVEKSKKQ
ncbi:hypothetical protein DNTS_021181 [Danionella cerebrum]|uniref:Uncharacterized protein n=1 Tax=Danionella cerebrum TaxID=2873325 RepID=A0A553RA75_9TELE|nr:hypothetical protein DNTS_021181 [Danionella translucida]